MAVDLKALAHALEGVDPELTERVIWVCVMADYERVGDPFTIEDAARPIERQWIFWNNWAAALLKVGCKNPRKPTVKQRQVAQATGVPLAAYPGTSDHGKEPAMAVDVGCDWEDNALRDRLVKMAGLEQKVPGEKWHLTKRPKRGPLPPLPKPESQKAPVSQEDDDMFTPARTIVWPDGSKTCVLPDGDVIPFGNSPDNMPPHFGGMGSLRSEVKQTFTEIIAITPVDLNNKAAGYWLWNKKDAKTGRTDSWEFNQRVLNELLGKK